MNTVNLPSSPNGGEELITLHLHSKAALLGLPLVLLLSFLEASVGPSPHCPGKGRQVWPGDRCLLDTLVLGGQATCSPSPPSPSPCLLLRVHDFYPTASETRQRDRETMCQVCHTGICLWFCVPAVSAVLLHG